MKNALKCIACVILAMQVALAQSAPHDNDKFKSAEQSFHQHKYEDAAHGYEQANKALGGQCFECFIGAARAYAFLGRHDEVTKFSSKAIGAAATPEQKFAAHLERSNLLLQIAPGSKDLSEAESEARKAIELRPDSITAHLSLAMALLRQNNDDAGLNEMKWAASRLPDGKEKLHIQAIIADPRRARFLFAPDFRAITSDGSTISLADAKGKVVLLDFWATWCPPCRDSVPEIKELRRKYGSDRLIVLSVSADERRENWSEYISRHNMSWTHSLDSENHPPMHELFNVHSFPTYIVLDGDGMVRERVNGLMPQQTLTARIHDILDKLLK